MSGTLSFYLSEFIDNFLPVFFMVTILCFVTAISFVADGYFDRFYEKYHFRDNTIEDKNGPANNKQRNLSES
jgi:hypothetical protein